MKLFMSNIARGKEILCLRFAGTQAMSVKSD